MSLLEWRSPSALRSTTVSVSDDAAHINLRSLPSRPIETYPTKGGESREEGANTETLKSSDRVSALHAECITGIYFRRTPLVRNETIRRSDSGGVKAGKLLLHLTIDQGRVALFTYPVRPTKPHTRHLWLAVHTASYRGQSTYRRLGSPPTGSGIVRLHR
ncbi:hypothetical protein LZ30DRAFT_298987 [Colletotrichum cereale]|nr:hypothetical protein LZ30DRAFT_298987 [Colletotrichum cereale]